MSGDDLEGAVAETDPDRRRASLSTGHSVLHRPFTIHLDHADRQRSDTVATTRGDMRPNRQCRRGSPRPRGRRRPASPPRSAGSSPEPSPLPASAPPAPERSRSSPVGQWEDICGLAMMWSARSGRTAVPMAKNSVVCHPTCVQGQQLDPDDSFGLQLLCLSLHPAHGQLPGIVKSSVNLVSRRFGRRCPWLSRPWWAMWYTQLPITMPSGA